MFERFTEAARQVVVVAYEEARLMRHEHIGTEHLLVALGGGAGGHRARIEPRARAGRGGARRSGSARSTTKRPSEQDDRPDPASRPPSTPRWRKRSARRCGSATSRSSRATCCWRCCASVTAWRAGSSSPPAPSPSEFREAVIGGSRAGAPASDAVVVRLGERVLGDLGHARVDARLLLAILERSGPMAAWLRERGVDEPTLRRMLEGA